MSILRWNGVPGTTEMRWAPSLEGTTGKLQQLSHFAFFTVPRQGYRWVSSSVAIENNVLGKTWVSTVHTKIGRINFKTKPSSRDDARHKLNPKPSDKTPFWEDSSFISGIYARPVYISTPLPRACKQVSELALHN